MTTTPGTHHPGPDEPAPYTLTPRGHATLADDPRPAAADGYVIPMCPGDDPGADWQEMGWDSHANAALAHVAWCPNHPGYWANGPAVMWEAFLRQLGPDEPVPLTLTPKAHAYLDEPVDEDQERWEQETDAAWWQEVERMRWACVRCGAGWFGPAPDDGLCPDCQDT